MEAHRRTHQGTNERDEIPEHGNGAGNNISEDGDSDGAAEPGSPVDEGVGSQMLGALEDADKYILCGQLHERLSARTLDHFSERRETHMDENQCTSQQARQRKAIADFLHRRTRGAQSRRRHIRPAVIVDHDSNYNVETGHDRLAYDERSAIMAGITHLRRDGEEGRSAGVREHHSGEGRGGINECCAAYDLVVGDPDARLRCG